MRYFFNLGSGFITTLMLLLLSSQTAQGGINVFATSTTTDLSTLSIGDIFTVDIVVSTTAPEATALGMRADGGDFLTATGNYVAPASIFNFAPSVPFGGINNNPALLGVSPDGTVSLFQGFSFSPAAGAGPDSFSVEFQATSIGSGTITVGQVAGHPEDIYLGGDNVYNSATLSYTVGGGGGPSGTVPEPSTAIAMGLLGVVGFAGNRRRRRTALNA